MKSVITGTVLLALLAAHGPIVDRFVRNHPHFAPQIAALAVVMFVGMLMFRLDFRRVAADGIRFRQLKRTVPLLFAGLILVATATAFDLPWLGVAAMSLLLVAISRILPERGVGTEGSLVRLSPLLLFAIGPPPFAAEALRSVLQLVTLNPAGRLLDALGYLHLWQRPTLSVPGTSFEMDSATSGGAASIWILLFVAVALSVWRSRSVVHTLAMLPVAACLASIVCVIDIVITAAVWESYGVDIHSGDPGLLSACVSLLCFVALLLSADSAIAVLTGPIPRHSDDNFWIKLRVAVKDPQIARLRNPLNAAWNWCFDSGSEDSGNGANSRAATSQRNPELAELLRPAYQFQWLKIFVVSWLRSRSKRRLLFGLPVIAVAAVAAACIVWIPGIPRERISGQYWSALDVSQDRPEADVKLKTLLLEKLLQLQPHDADARHQLAMHRLQQGEIDQAVKHIRRLTDINQFGHVPTRLWLVDQAAEANSVIPLSADQIQQQLLKAAAEAPKNATAQNRLATYYLDNGQLLLAEKQFLTAAELDATLELPLALLQRQLQRDESQISVRLEKAAAAFQNELKANAANEDARRNLAAVRVLQQQTDVAEQILRDGVAESDSPEARNSLARFYRDRAMALLNESAFNRDAAAELVTRALSLQPDDTAAIHQLLDLKLQGARFNNAQLRSAVHYWQQKAGSTPEDSAEHASLAELLICLDENAAAAETLEPLAAAYPKFRAVLAKQWLLAGQKTRASGLVQQLLTEYQSRLVVDPDDLDAAASLAELLIAVHNYRHARDFLLRKVTSLEPTNASTQTELRIRTAFVQACLAEFDRQSSDGTFSHAAVRHGNDPAVARESIGLLADVLSVDSINRDAVQRTAQTAFMADQRTGFANELLNIVLAQGAMTTDVYVLAGSYAMLADQLEQARTYFERANRLASNDPIVQNGLALTLIRQSPENRDQALALANAALEKLPEHPDLLSTRAEIHIALKDWRAARYDLELSAQRQPGSRETHELLASVYESLQQPALAAEQRRIVTRLTTE